MHSLAWSMAVPRGRAPGDAWCSLIHSAPPFLSGLTVADVAFVQTKVEQHVAPEIAKARDATLKAMKEAEQGWQRAVDKIGERAGLTKGADGTWRDPSMSEAA